MATGGQFTLEKWGQLRLVAGGQFDWIFQITRCSCFKISL